MDCLAFRRLLLADPESSESAIVDHINDCEQCRGFRRDLRRFGASLENAINVPVPGELRAKILLRQSNKPALLGTWRIASVLAACCVIAVAIGVRIETANSPNRWLGAVKDYVRQTEVAPALSATIAHQDVNRILSQIGVHLDPNIGIITAAVPCVIGNRQGAHLVVSGDQGPVTVLIMPTAELPQSIAFRTTEFNGVIAPCPRGSIAVVGHATEPIEEIRSRFEKAITFI